METKNYIDIAKGEPDFHTPDFVKQAAIEAIHANRTKYTPFQGILELREAASRKFHHQNGLDAHPDDIVVTCGGKHALYLAFASLLEPGDEAIILAPYWMAYPKQILMAGGTPVFVQTQEDRAFAPDIEAIKESLTPRTRLVILNSPSNPTGAVYSRGFLQKLGELAVERQIYIVSDEVYETILFDGAAHVSIASLDTAFAQRTVTINSVSKTHAMTGWRIGYALFPKSLAQKASGIISSSTSAPSSVSQYAALAALEGDQSHVAMMAASYAERRAFLGKRIEELPHCHAIPPQGAFYFFMNISGLLGSAIHGHAITNADDYMRLALESAYVHVHSGVLFGASDHLRLSFAVSMDALKEGMDRLERLNRDGEV